MLPADTATAHDSLIQFLYRAPVGLVQADLSGAVEMINPTAAQLLMPMATNGDLDNLFALLGSVAPGLAAAAQASAGDSGWTESLRTTLPARPAEPPQVLAVHLSKLDGQRVMAVIQDVSLQVAQEQRALDRRLHEAARTDTLTQAPNRAELRDRIAQLQATAGAKPGAAYALIFLNGDRFKRINDRLGAAVGDRLLGLVVTRLRSLLRAGQAEVARVGGDEFAVLLRNLSSPDDAVAIGTRVVDVLLRPYPVDGHTLTCSFSAGLVHGDQGDGDANDLLRDASVAMIEAKRQGGGRLVGFEPAMRERAIQRGRVEADLRTALAGAQLFVVYQPIVALQPATGPRCEGVEALMRWRHPQRGVVSPMEFISVAEECGLIYAVGEFVLAQACRQLRQWQVELGDRAPRSVSVNLSRARLQQPDFVDWQRVVLQDSGLLPKCLQLEVTESLAAEDEAVRAVLREIKALGVTLALDDFGTGYSSLACVHHFPVDAVKIDRSFTSQVSSSENHRVLVQAKVLVARSLAISTVVEGIETDAQAGIVRELGCDKGQGYLFSHPLPADALRQWLLHGDPAWSNSQPFAAPTPQPAAAKPLSKISQRVITRRAA